MAPRVWLITGTSSGFGGELVKVVLEKGDICVATARNPAKLSFEGEFIHIYVKKMQSYAVTIPVSIL